MKDLKAELCNILLFFWAGSAVESGSTGHVMVETRLVVDGGLAKVSVQGLFLERGDRPAVLPGLLFYIVRKPPSGVNGRVSTPAGRPAALQELLGCRGQASDRDGHALCAVCPASSPAFVPLW